MMKSRFEKGGFKTPNGRHLATTADRSESRTNVSAVDLGRTIRLTMATRSCHQGGYFSPFIMRNGW